MDVTVDAQLVIPGSELMWRFSRSSGPGGQHVNTSDSRVELLWRIQDSAAISADQRERLVAKLGKRLNNGTLSVTSSEQRSQLRNRESAQAKLAAIVSTALAPEPRSRKATKPSKGSKRRHLIAKTQRSQTKALRRRPLND